MQEIIQKKYYRLKSILAELPMAAVAFSGGVDSSLLLHTCLETLGTERVMALTARSPLVPKKELQEACDLAQNMGVTRHVIVDTPDLNGFAFKNNPRDRCYFCKKEILSSFLKLLEEGQGCCLRGGARLMEGTNHDDLKAYRPGRQAVLELKVSSPLLQVELGKKEIRHLSQSLGLTNWDLPSQACLASRIPYGESLDEKKLLQVEKGEEIIKKLGFGECRLRHHGSLARLEIPSQDLELLMSLKIEIAEKIKALGFTCVTLDLEALRSGCFD